MPPGKSGLPKPAPPSDETIQRLLEVQIKELAVRTRELDLRQAELTNSAKWAEASLQAHERDRKDERTHQRRSAINRYIAAGLTLVCCLVFAGFALYLNKDAIVLESLKLIGSALVGFGGGYFYGRSRPSPHPDDNGDADT